MNGWYAGSCSMRAGVEAGYVKSKEDMNNKRMETKHVPQNKLAFILLEMKNNKQWDMFPNLQR